MQLNNNPLYKLLIFFKENKKIGFVFGIIILLVLAIVFSTVTGSSSSLNPFFRINQRGSTFSNYNRPNITTQEVQNPLVLIDTFPKSGEYASLDTFEVLSFEFSAPVNHLTAKITVSPNLNIKVLPDADNPKIIHIIPKDLGWQKDINYQITFDKLSSSSGGQLNSSLVHFFKRIEPEELLNEPLPD